MSKRKKIAIEQADAKKQITNADASKSLQKGTKMEIRWINLSSHGKFLTVLIIGILSLAALGTTMKYLEDNARQNATNVNNPNSENEPSLLAKINPFDAAAMKSPSPTPLPLSKEYIYAGSRTLAVEDANANAAPSADLAVWRPTTGVWWIMGGTGSQQFSTQWGQSGDKALPGDYDGDSKTDLSIFRLDTTAHTATWYILYSSTNSWASAQFGADDDKAAPADYDGDGRTDIAVWRMSTGVWYILRSSDNGISYAYFGATGDIVSPGDYDGDGKADIAVWRDSDKTFYSTNSSNQAVQTATFTLNSIDPVSADYDGDGRADYAIRNGANWIIRHSSTGTIQSPISWQSGGDVAVQNDYDADGKVDIGVWKDSNGTWYIRQSKFIGQSNELRQVQWGQSGDKPVPAFYRR